MGIVRVAIHQPNYLPWLGYFHKILSCDVFVLLDTVQFERRGYTHRVRIGDRDGGLHWLTQHIRKQPMQDYWIKDVTFADSLWVEKHLKTLRSVYGRAVHFKPVFDLVEAVLREETSSLSTLNGALIRTLCDALRIPTRIVHASEIDIPDATSPSERMALLTRELGGTHYLSGAGARAYNDEAIFDRYGVALTYNNFAMTPYPQFEGEFQAGLSVIDALFHLGPEAAASLLRTPAQDFENSLQSHRVGAIPAGEVAH